MTDEILGHLFISYSHVDKNEMLKFLKHLKGMLLGRMQVWSDDDITEGSTWESLLHSSLTQANAALVLASPDYLISPWCRKELKELVGAYEAKRVRNVFWVQLRPCGWKHTELRDFQSSGTTTERAISELQDEAHREREILQSCEVVAAELGRSITQEDRHLAFVRRLLAQDRRDDLTVHEILHVGAFSIVCRGSMGAIDAAIKVLRRPPLERMSEDFVRIGESRMRVGDPSFIPIHKIFQVGLEDEKRTIIVSDYVSNNRLLSNFLTQGTAIPISEAAPLLRRTSEALAALHAASNQDLPANAGERDAWEYTLGLLTPGDIYYDQVAHRLRMPVFGVSSFLWHVLDWGNYVDWVDRDSEIYVAPEQLSKVGPRVTPKIDQYMLGRLAVEILEGQPFKRILEAKNAKADAFWADPASFINGDWKRDHRQLWDIVRRLLEPQPENRWGSITEVVRRLRSLEEEHRALAKRVFLPAAEGEGGTKLKDNVEFFKQFYNAFFAVSPESRAKFENTNLEGQHTKLMHAMVAVLNFREGNEPTSLDAILAKHCGKGITAREFETFHKVFLQTLDEVLGENDRVHKAWDDLLHPVVEYMVSACVDPATSPPNNAKTPRRIMGSDRTDHDSPVPKP